MTTFAGASAFLFADQAVEAKQGRPEHKEVQQGLPQQTLHGVYQIGDV